MADKEQALSNGLELADKRIETSKTLINRLVRKQLWPQRKRILTTFLCMVLVAATSASMIYLLKDVVDQVLIARDREMLYLLPGAIIALAIVSGIAG